MYSKHAEGVTLIPYGTSDFVKPLVSYSMDFLRNKSGRIWHCRIPTSSARSARCYAYSVSGPAASGGFEQHAFSPQKILLDPYARAALFPPGFERAAACRSGSNAGKAPRGVLTGEKGTSDWCAHRKGEAEEQAAHEVQEDEQDFDPGR